MNQRCIYIIGAIIWMILLPACNLSVERTSNSVTISIVPTATDALLPTATSTATATPFPSATPTVEIPTLVPDSMLRPSGGGSAQDTAQNAQDTVQSAQDTAQNSQGAAQIVSVRPGAPFDALEGLRVPGMGGGGGACIMASHYDLRGLGGSPIGQVQSGSFFTYSFPGGGYAYDDVSDFLTLCSNRLPASGIAESPSGQSYALSVIEDYRSEARGYIHLPLEAFITGGIWQIHVFEPEPVSFMVDIVLPSQPYYVMGEAGGNVKIAVGGFRSQERLFAIFVEDSVSHFEFEVDSHGTALVETGLSGFAWNTNLIIFNEAGSFVHSSLLGLPGFDGLGSISNAEFMALLTRRSGGGQTGGSNNTICSNFLPARLSVGMQAYVSDTLPNRLRAQPDTGAIIGSIPSNAVFNVVGGPQCGAAQDIRWWEVEYNGLRGWTAEGQGDVYWLAPGRPAQPSGVPGCPGFLPSRLRVGMTAYVSDSEPNNIRAAAASGTIYGQIPAGARFAVVGGPICDSQQAIMWWEVEYNGIRGWTAEGRGNIYWLAPTGS